MSEGTPEELFAEAEGVHVELAQQVLDEVNHRPVVITFNNWMTRYDIMFTSMTSAVFIGEAKDISLKGAVPLGDYLMVSMLEFRTCYPFKLRHNAGDIIHPAYVAEKLHLGGQDGVAVAGLLQTICDLGGEDDR